MPNVVVPVCFDAASRRRVGLPMILNCDADFNGASSISDCVAALAISSPNVARLPEVWRTVPESTVISEGATFHSAAAAPTSIARAEAPAWRIGSQRSFTLDEPPVIMTPISRIVFAVNHAAVRWISP